MSRPTIWTSPLLLGFDELEQMLDRISRASADGYPPYNIERVGAGAAAGDAVKITLAVAGFTRDQLEITVTGSQLTIRGRQDDPRDRTYLHRGIAARQFQRTFVLADRMEVGRAVLADGLLSIEVARLPHEPVVRQIPIEGDDG